MLCDREIDSKQEGKVNNGVFEAAVRDVADDHLTSVESLLGVLGCVWGVGFRLTHDD